MKFSVQQQEIYTAVLNTAKASSSKSTIPALEGILLELDGNNLTITGYDLDIGIRTVVPVKGEKSGSIVINARLLSELIRKMPDGEILFDVSENYMVNISSRDIQFSVMGTTDEDYPTVPGVHPEKSFQLPQSLLKEMIGQTLFAVAANDLKPVHTGSKFDIVDGVLHIVSVDGIRMAMRQEKLDFEDMAFVVPGKTLAEVSRMLEDNADKKVILCVDKNQISFEIDRYTIISRLLEGDFINYKNAMNFSTETIAVVNVREVSESLERAMLLINEKHKSPVKLEFENGTLKVSCTTSLGKVSDVIAIDYTGAYLKVGVNAKYLLDAVRHSNSDKVKLMLVSPLSPIKLLPLDGDSFTFLVLPMRMKD